MNIDGKSYTTIWLDPADENSVWVIDQRLLPHRLEVVVLKSLEDACHAISDMVVRGAPLIGVTAAYGMYLASVHALKGMRPEQASQEQNLHLRTILERAAQRLLASRPTAVNLAWAVDQQMQLVNRRSDDTAAQLARHLLINAGDLANQEIQICRQIGNFGRDIIKELSQRQGGRPVNILTHCNAGWLCSVDWGTATAPIYTAFNEGVAVHVWVDETRPRNQGATLTAWELGKHGVPYTLITDNAGGHLMQRGMVDAVIVGTDRVTRCGDVANKIGTYLKALAAHDNQVPFYVAAPSTSIDWALSRGEDIPIEERNEDEVKYVTGFKDGALHKVLISPADAKAANYGFDVTPARLVTGIITERGITEANEQDLLQMFPERRLVEIK